MQPLFFVHIPKTAGTSFRLAAAQYFTKERIVHDYGLKSGETSLLVRDCLYGDNVDWWRFNRECRERTVAMVGGHVPVHRFVSLFGVSNTVAFVREPLQRIASEYAHFVRNYDYKGSFRDFYSRPVMRNRQTKLLQGVDLAAIGFVGLTERYEESLELLNARYHTEIAYRENNLGKTSLDASHDISTDEQAELVRMNRQDIALYKRATGLFEARLALPRKGVTYVHAKIQKADTQHVAGWAWWASGGDEPVEVAVYVNGSCVGTRRAVDFRPGACRWLPPRGGYVGFHLPLEAEVGDTVQCRVVDTGQKFPMEPLTVVAPESK